MDQIQAPLQQQKQIAILRVEVDCVDVVDMSVVARGPLAEET